MRDIALAIIIFGTLPFILMRPYFGLLVWSWLGYMNPHRLTYGFAFSFPWVQIVAITTLLAFAFGSERKRMPIATVTLLLFAFLIWTGITTIFAVEPAAAWQKYSEFSKTMIMVFATLILVNNRERMHWLIWVIVGSLGFYGVKGGIWTILHGGVNHVFGPPDSFITDNNALALALSMTIPLMRYLQLHSTQKWVRRGLMAAMLLTGIAVLGTYSRGGVVALVIVAVALFLKSRGRLAVVAVAVVFGVVVIGIGCRGGSGKHHVTVKHIHGHVACIGRIAHCHHLNAVSTACQLGGQQGLLCLRDARGLPSGGV